MTTTMTMMMHSVSTVAARHMTVVAAIACLARLAEAQSTTFTSAFTTTNILAARASSGVVVVDELLATVVNSAPVQSALVSGCRLSPATQTSYGSMSADGTTAMFVCGTSSSTTRNITRITYTGAIDTATRWTTGAAANQIGGVCSADGAFVIANDFKGTFVGTAGGVLTADASFGSSTEYGCVVAPNLANGTVYVGLQCSSSTTVPCPAANSALFYFGTALANSVPLVPGTTGFSTGQKPLSIPAIGQLAVTAVNSSFYVIYVGADSITAGTGGLYKLTSTTGLASGVWASAAFGVGAVKNPAAGVGVHGLTGRKEGSVFALYLSTSAATLNYVYRYDSSFDASTTAGSGYTLLSTAPAGYGYLAVMVVPVQMSSSASPTSSRTPTSSGTTTSTSSPSSTNSPSASLTTGISISSSFTDTPTISSTPTNTASASATVSATATPTASLTSSTTGSLTASNTGSPSATLTSTATPPPPAFAAPFSAANVLVVRSDGSNVIVDEYGATAVSQAAPVQSAFISGCSLATGARSYGSMSADGQFGVFACGVTTSTARAVTRIAYTGAFDSVSHWTTGAAANQVGGACSADGSFVVANDFKGTFVGTAGNTLTADASFGLSSQAGCVVAPGLANGTAYVGLQCASSTTVPCPAANSALFYFGNNSVPLVPGNTGFITGQKPLNIPAVGQLAVTVVNSSFYIIYIGADSTIVGTGGLYKLTSTTGLASGVWASAAFGVGAVKNPLLGVGVHGLVGRTEASGYALYLTTSAATQNFLYRYDTGFDASTTAGSGYTQLAAAPAGSGYLSALIVPIQITPSSTGTPSSTATSSATSSASSTPSPSTTLSPLASASNSATAASTTTSSITSSNTPTTTSTPSGTSTPTPPPLAFGAPFSAVNVLVVRSDGSNVIVDEYGATAASQAAPVQSAFVSGCTLATGARSYGSMSADGQAGVFACGNTTSTARAVTRIAYTGAFDSVSHWTTGAAANQVGGACSADGSFVVANDFKGTFVGTAGNTLTADASFGVSSQAGCVVAPGLANGTAYVGLQCASSTTVPCPAANSALFYFGNNSAPLVPGNTGFFTGQKIGVPAIGQLAVTTVNSSYYVIYVGADSTTVGTGGLYKLTSTTGLASGVWASAAFGVGAVKNPLLGVGVHGLVGRTEASGCALYLTTSAATQNFLYRYDTGFDASTTAGSGYTLLGAAPAGSGFLSALVVPVQVTPSQTASATITSSSSSSASPTASASVTASPSSTLSSLASNSKTPTPARTTSPTPTETQSPSITGSGTTTSTTTPTTTVTPTTTSTPTGTATPSPPPLAFAAPPGAASLLVVRSDGAKVIIDEYGSTAASQAAPVQSALVSGCSLATGARSYGSMSADGTTAMFVCGTSSSTARNITRIANSGAFDSVSHWTTGAAANQVGGVCSVDGAFVIANDFRGTFVGTAGGVLTADAGFGSSSQAGCVVAPGLANGTVYVGLQCASSTAVPCPAANSALFYFGTALANSVPLVPGTTGFNSGQKIGVPAIGQLAVTTVNSSYYVIYVGADSTTAGTGGLYKLTSTTGLASAAWALTNFGVGAAKNPLLGVGVHGLVGRTEVSGYALYLTTSAATQNFLYRYDTSFDASSTAGSGYTQLAAAPAGSGFLSALVVPNPPSATATPPPTHTPSGTASVSPTASSSASVSSTPSSSGSATITSSSSWSGSRSGTRSPAGSATRSRSGTATFSISLSGTSQATVSASPAGTPPGTPAVTPASTASTTMSSSASASASASDSATGSYTTPPTKSVTKTATKTASRTRSLSPTPSSAATLSPVGTPSSSLSASSSTSATPSSAVTPPSTPAGTPPPSPAGSPPSSASPSSSGFPSPTSSASGSVPTTPSKTPTRTDTSSKTPTKTATPTRSPSRTATHSKSPSRSPTPTKTATHTASPSKSVTRTRTATRKAKLL